MNSERHQLITDLLSQALEQAPGERAAFLENACAGDAELRREVESLIFVLEESPSFIESPAVAGFAEVFAAKAEDRFTEGQRIGHYRIIREIGRGGMGAVYLAERADEYREQVALKIVKRGMDTDFVLRRFRHERQILASLHHPNIARLLDGGTTEDGLPYFVMEYIEGRPVDEYCDLHNLPVVERLNLFRTICAAVHYAHQSLVIHRDIKPGNILIMEDGTPKLLDFGIAKILNPEISQTVEKTATLMRLMTPEYASPEQVRGEPVTTATDVYSLGVVLYELLTGHRPYHITSILPSDIERIICNQEPVKPSTAVNRPEERLTSGGETIIITPDQVSRTREGQPEKLRRRLTGDLDNIVLMALRKEPARRYASVEHLAEDIRRHLEGLPVNARRDTLSYRASKFVLRHKVGVAAAALVVLSLIAGLIATVWQARRAQAAQARAERRFNDVRKLANSYLFEFHDEIAKVPGSTAARVMVVKRALEYLDSLAGEASGDQSLQLELATAYQKVGDAQGRPGFASIGDRQGALESYRKAIGIRQALVDAGMREIAVTRDLATTHDRIGDTLLTSGDTAGALAAYRQGYALRERLMGQNPSDPESRRDFATSAQRVAQALWMTGKLDEARENQSKSLALYEALANAAPRDAVAQRNLFIAYIKDGDLMAAGGDKEGGLRRYRQALPISVAVAGIAEDKTRARREMANAHDKVGNLLAATKDFAGALENYRTALTVRAAIAAADSNNAEIKRDLSISHEKIGNMFVKAGNLPGALAEFGQALEIDTKLSEADPQNAQARLDRASSHEKIADLLIKSGNLAGALDGLNQARKLREEVAAKDQQNAEVRSDLALTYKQLGVVCATMAKKARSWERLQEAKQWYEQGLATLRELQQRGALDKDGEAELANISGVIAECDAALRNRE